MFNVMLDELPAEYKGYQINTDFRIGIQIGQVINDPDLSAIEKSNVYIDLLFGGYGDLPDIRTAGEGVNFFMSGWYTDKNVKDKENSAPVTDMDIDQWRIYSAFWSQYHIDLNRAELHYWAFMGLLVNLNDCAYTKIIDLRSRKIADNLDGAQRKAMAQMKERYALPVPETEEDREAKRQAEEFLKHVTIHRG